MLARSTNCVGEIRDREKKLLVRVVEDISKRRCTWHFTIPEKATSFVFSFSFWLVFLFILADHHGFLHWHFNVLSIIVEWRHIS